MQSPDGTDYDILGPTGAPVIALIHGLGLTRATWSGHLDALTQSYRVLNYDLAGHGKSAVPDNEITLSTFSEQLVGLMDQLAIASVAAVGFSLGGMINRRIAMDHPERVWALGILNSPHERGTEGQALVEQRARDTSAGGAEATIDATLARWFTEDFRNSAPDAVAKIRAGVLANDPVTYAKCRWVLANGVVELIRPDPPISTPSLVMTCEHDTGSTPAMSHVIASEIAGSETIIVPGLQHMGLVEQPDLFTAPVLDFLDRHAPKETS
jgi:pimeloyl-ACP methyl ester carboxylesterase